MSHITIIISKMPTPAEGVETMDVSYEYVIPIPHDATPDKVATLVRQAYRRLEGSQPRVSDE